MILMGEKGVVATSVHTVDVRDSMKGDLPDQAVNDYSCTNSRIELSIVDVTNFIVVIPHQVTPECLLSYLQSLSVKCN